MPSVGLGKNLQGVEVDHHHFNLLSNRRWLTPIRLGSRGPPGKKNYIGGATLMEGISPAHICKKKATRMIQSNSNYMSMKLHSLIRWCHFFFSLRVFAASLVWPELFKANLVRNNGELTAEEYQHQSSLICVIWVLQVIFRLQTFKMQSKEGVALPAPAPLQSLNFVLVSVFCWQGGTACCCSKSWRYQTLQRGGEKNKKISDLTIDIQTMKVRNQGWNSEKPHPQNCPLFRISLEFVWIRRVDLDHRS